MKKKTPKRTTKKSTGARKTAPAKRTSTQGTPAAVDPIQAALARRRAAMLGR